MSIWQIRQLLAVLLTLLLPMPTAACPVCIELPEVTPADRLLGDELAVWARPDPNSPFRFIVKEVVRGDPERVKALPQIPYLVSSAARAALARDPAAGVVFTYGATSGGGPSRGTYEAWHWIFIVTPTGRHAVNEIVTASKYWKQDFLIDPARFEHFASLTKHRDRSIRNMALAEISRAPYSLVRTHPHFVPTAELRRRLSTIAEAAYSQVSILLLGISQDPEAQAYVRRRYEEAVRFGGEFLDAWAVAGIEVDGRTALARISDRLSDAKLPVSQRRDLIRALAVTGGARPELRANITPILKTAAQAHRDLVAEVAEALLQWADWSLTSHYEDVLATNDIDPATRYLLEMIVASAPD